MFKKLMSNFLRTQSFGLDISDDSLKLVKISTTKGGLTLNTYGEKKIPAGVIDSGKIKDAKKLERALQALKKDFRLNSVSISLHNENIQNIGEYISAFKNVKISTNSFEAYSKTVTRALIKKGDKETYMIVNFNKRHSDIFIVSKGTPVFIYTLAFGGDNITNAIANKFPISLDEAEKIKKDFGLKRRLDNKEIFKVISHTVTPLRDDIAKFFLYWHTKKGEKQHRPLIKKIILCGSESNLAGFSEYLTVSLRTKVEMADVWVNFKERKGDIPELSLKQSFGFAPAIGAALSKFIIDP